LLGREVGGAPTELPENASTIPDVHEVNRGEKTSHSPFSPDGGRVSSPLVGLPRPLAIVVAASARCTRSCRSRRNSVGFEGAHALGAGESCPGRLAPRRPGAPSHRDPRWNTSFNDGGPQPRSFSAVRLNPGGLTLVPRLSFQFMGTRPVGGWHGHGWTRKSLVVLTGGKQRKVVLHKHRRLLPGTTTTCHSRPPDDPAFIRFCTLIVVLRVWSFINSAVGLCKQPDLEGFGSKRTVQRWTAIAMGRALETQQAIRAAILDLRRSEPRPDEDWFRGALSPPPGGADLAVGRARGSVGHEGPSASASARCPGSSEFRR
jgi:hypothetical protein